MDSVEPVTSTEEVLPEVSKVHGLGREFVRYFLVSLVALGADLGLLLLLSQIIHYAFAATVSFIAGAIVHYALSVVFVFKRRKLISRKLIESVLFVAIGGGGLVVNVAVIAACVEFFSAPLTLAKLVAAGFSFVFGYVVRKVSLF